MPALKSYHYFVTTATDWRGKPCCFIHVYSLQFDKKILEEYSNNFDFHKGFNP